MQGTDPAKEAAQCEMSKKESEGHSSAASFIDTGKVHFPLQKQPGYRLNSHDLQILHLH